MHRNSRDIVKKQLEFVISIKREAKTENRKFADIE